MLSSLMCDGQLLGSSKYNDRTFFFFLLTLFNNFLHACVRLNSFGKHSLARMLGYVCLAGDLCKVMIVMRGLIRAYFCKLYYYLDSAAETRDHLFYYITFICMLLRINEREFRRSESQIIARITRL